MDFIYGTALSLTRKADGKKLNGGHTIRLQCEPRPMAGRNLPCSLCRRAGTRPGAGRAAPATSGTATAPAAPAAPEAPPPGLWINGIHLSAQIEGGVTINPADPNSGVNFGRLFDDHADQPLLNQLLLTANKPLDPKPQAFDWGFKLQGMYGSDARYTHFLGVFDQKPGPGYRNQFDIVEANVLLHLPCPDGRRHGRQGRSCTRRRWVTKRSIRRPTRSTRTPTSSTSACR